MTKSSNTNLSSFVDAKLRVVVYYTYNQYAPENWCFKLSVIQGSNASVLIG